MAKPFAEEERIDGRAGNRKENRFAGSREIRRRWKPQLLAWEPFPGPMATAGMCRTGRHHSRLRGWRCKNSSADCHLVFKLHLYHSWCERDPYLVIDQCHIVHGERRVERHTDYQRNAVGNSSGCGHSYVYVDVYGQRRNRQRLSDADRERTLRAYGHNLGFAVEHYAWIERDTHMVVDQRHIVHGQRRVERRTGYQRYAVGNAVCNRNRHL